MPQQSGVGSNSKQALLYINRVYGLKSNSVVEPMGCVQLPFGRHACPVGLSVGLRLQTRHREEIYVCQSN